MQSKSFAFKSIQSLCDELISPIRMTTPTNSPHNHDDPYAKACENAYQNVSTPSEINFNQLTPENKLAVMQYINLLHTKETTQGEDNNIAAKLSFHQGFFEPNPEAQLLGNTPSPQIEVSSSRIEMKTPTLEVNPPSLEVNTSQQASPSTSNSKKRKQAEETNENDQCCLQTLLAKNPDTQNTEVYKPGPVFSKDIPYKKPESLKKKIEPYRRDPVIPLQFEARPLCLNPPSPTLRFEKETYIGSLHMPTIELQQPQANEQVQEASITQPEVVKEQAPPPPLTQIELSKPQMEQLQQPEVTQQQPEVTQQQPEVIQQQPEVIQQQPKVIQQAQVQQQPEVIQQQPEVIQQQHKVGSITPVVIPSQTVQPGNPVSHTNFSREERGHHYSDEAEAVIMWEANRRRKRFPTSRRKPPLAFWQDCIVAYPRLLGGRDAPAVQRKYERLIKQMQEPRRRFPRQSNPTPDASQQEQVNQAQNINTQQPANEGPSANELPFFQPGAYPFYSPGINPEMNPGMNPGMTPHKIR